MKHKQEFLAGQYGFIPLSELVDRFMIHSFNNGRKGYYNMLRIAADVWKDLYWKTLKTTKNKRLRIDLSSGTVQLPHDCLRLLDLRVPGACGGSVHLKPGDLILPSETETRKGCGCTDCNCDSDVCLATSSVEYMTEDVVMNNTTYQRVIKTLVKPGGTLVQEITEPFATKQTINGSETTVVVMRTHEEIIAPLQVKPCGCVKATPENRQLCYDYGCCPVACCTPSCRDLDDRPGLFKLDREARLIYLYDVRSEYITISYQSNGEESLQEIMIPEYCQEAMFAGLYSASVRFRMQTVGFYEKREAKRNFIEEKAELFEFLNPIVPRIFLELQSETHKW